MNWTKQLLRTMGSLSCFRSAVVGLSTLAANYQWDASPCSGCYLRVEDYHYADLTCESHGHLQGSDRGGYSFTRMSKPEPIRLSAQAMVLAKARNVFRISTAPWDRLSSRLAEIVVKTV